MASSANFNLSSVGSCSRLANPRVFCTGSFLNVPPNLRAPRKRVSMFCRSYPKFKGTQVREQKLSELIEEKVSEAKEVCAGNESSDECKVAWDEVEEVSQAKAHFRQRAEKKDPLEEFCKENPETDECRMYED
uniref:CP12 domain-containing protein n=1 Tax=Araucaria cunninghamii TaxID=56994 RepID=A0A0D6R4M5_ARACU